MLAAYRHGIFPMAGGRDQDALYWFDPPERGIIPMDGFHIPKRLHRRLNRRDYLVKLDRHFDQVVAACAAPRRVNPASLVHSAAPESEETWINGHLEKLYHGLFAMGAAHSVEIWCGDALVGGLFGVAIGGAFFGESMFHRAQDASKIALVHLVALLSHAGFSLLDSQFTTAHLAQFGAIAIPRRDYHAHLAEALARPAHFPTAVDWDYFEDFLHRQRGSGV